MAITKVYRGTAELADVLKIYKGSELVYEKEVEPSYPPNVVVFKSSSPGTIKPRYTRSGITLQYSIDRGLTWNNISSGGTTASSDEIWFRGRAKWTKSLYTSYDTSNAWVFSAGTPLHVYGDLRYLLCDNLGDSTITFNIDSYCFSNMFDGCSNLATAPELPATTLADYCYFYMFRGCKYALTTAPELPATTLAKSCYSYMFAGCERLTTAPSLPATTLADYCYDSMFQECKRLTTAPSLPATTLAERCYYQMFYKCANLATAPELPATTLAKSCYEFMFERCTSLTTAPSLPATELANSCYCCMFKTCTSLTTAPSLPATTLADNCYRGMFDGCTAFRVSETKDGSYQYPWRIPTSGTGRTATDWNSYMLSNTGGPYRSAPVINTTYYVENPPV
jgi:hypothetical protein